MGFQAEDFKDDQDFQDFIKKATAEAVAGMSTKNTELLDELKGARDKLKNFEGLDLETLTAKAKQLEEIEKKEMEEKGEYEKIIAQMKEDHQKTVDKLTKKLESSDNAVNKYLVEGGLAAELATAKCNPVMIPAAVKLLAEKVSVLREGEDISTQIGDKTIGDYIKDWADTEIGKNFILADGNGGGGAGGGGGGGGDSVEDFFNPQSPKHNYTEQAKVQTENPELYAQYRKKYQVNPMANRRV